MKKIEVFGLVCLAIAGIICAAVIMFDLPQMFLVGLALTLAGFCAASWDYAENRTDAKGVISIVRTTMLKVFNMKKAA